MDVVSKNGCLLLNVGPRPDGTIPEEAQNILLAMGRWLQTNGEAIYGTRPWKTYGEGSTVVNTSRFGDASTKPYTGQDIRFTMRGDTLYAVALAWPENGKLTIKSLATGSPYTKAEIRSVRLLGSPAKLTWKRGPEGMTIQLPAQKPGDYAFAFKISPVDPVPEGK
jgi:alpha-L-fucosidase